MKKILPLLLFFYSLFCFSQNVQLFDQFNGRVDFTAIGNTLNPDENTTCSLLPQSSASLNIQDLGNTVSIQSAHLYWSSVGSGDFDVALNNTPVTASRTFALTASTGLNYFGAYADVTNIVTASGNGLYTFSDLDVSGVIGNYCGNGTNYGGWSIIIIFEDPSLLLNQVSLFDGLESVSGANPNLTINVGPLNVSSDVASRIGFLAWEGDSGIAVNETLSMTVNGGPQNGTTVNLFENPLNPVDNAFNGTNTYTGSSVNFNMDLDAYEIANFVDPTAATSFDVTLTSGQDLILVNNIITSLNSILPDATIEITNVGVLCENNDITIDYTVFNGNATSPLPAVNSSGQPTLVAFYADAVFLGQAAIMNDIPINGSEAGTITLNLPLATPTIFNLIAVVDDDGTGTGTVTETNETNNDFIEPIDQGAAGIDFGSSIEACDGTPVTLDTGLTSPPFTISWFESGVEIVSQRDNPILLVDGVTIGPGTYTVEAIDGACRVESPPVTISFNTQPVANPAPDIFRCDDGTTVGNFNLRDNEPTILGGQNPADFNFEYYTTLAGAQNEDPAFLIAAPNNHVINPPSPERIFVRMENSNNSCVAFTDFRIFFSRAIAGNIPANFSICDLDNDGSEIIDLESEFNIALLDGENSSDYTITYYTTQADADAGVAGTEIPNPDSFSITTANSPITFYARLENRDDASCFDTSQNVTVSLDTPPTIVATPPTLIICDATPNDGFADFTLSDATPEITLGDTSLLVTYHGTQSDAQNGINEIPVAPATTYENNDPYQDEVYARVVRANSTCYAITTVNLRVHDMPNVVAPADPLTRCDENNPGDGFEEFDLTDGGTIETEILDGLNPTEYDFYYFEVEQNAIDAGDSVLLTPPGDFSQAIPDPTMFTNSTMGAQTIYVLVVGNNTSTSPPNPNGAASCYTIVELNLIVNTLPVVVQPGPYLLCDDEIFESPVPDQITVFDLTSQEGTITNNNPGLTVNWFEINTSGVLSSPIADPANYANRTIPPMTLPTPQTVFAEVVDGTTGCAQIVSLTLDVQPIPEPNFNPDPLELCDDDDDGIVAGFDLQLATTQIANGEPVTVTYYNNLPDAEAGVGTNITAPYTGFDGEIIYARVTNDVPPANLPCFAIVELPLVVTALPDIPNTDPALGPVFQDPLIGCDESGNGRAIFDLTVQDDAVLGTQNPADFVAPITYYEDQMDAEMGVNALPQATAEAFNSAGQTIWVRLESLVTGCARVTPFEIEVLSVPVIGSYSGPLELCDDEESGSTTDGFSVFNLRQNENEITLGNSSLVVTYYETQADQEAGTNPIIDPENYQNRIVPPATVASPQDIFVTISEGTVCDATAVLTLIVNPNPTPNLTPDPLVLCEMDNDGIEVFDLTLATPDIIGGITGVSISYHRTRDDAILGINLITTGYANDEPYNDVPVTDPLSADFGTGGVWVRVEDTTTGCYTIVPLALEVRDTPDAITPTPLRACDINGTGTAIFDLTDKEEEILGNYPVADHTQFDVFYFEVEQDAIDAGDAALGLTPPYNFPTAIPDVNTTMYSNNANPQLLYVLILGNDTSISPNNGTFGCYDIVELELIVDPIPPEVTLDPLRVCDGSDPMEVSSTDEISFFDLTLRDNDATGGNPLYIVNWFEDLALTIPIPDPTRYENLGTPQTVYAQVVDQEFDSNCSRVLTLEISVEPIPQITNFSPEPLEACDDDDDGITQFNLTDKDAEITNGELNVAVTYFETEQAAIDNIAGTNLTDPYTNTTPFTQVVYARVETVVSPPDVLLNCFVIVELTLNVIALPDAPNTDPDLGEVFNNPLEVCDDDENGSEPFDLTLQDNAVIAGQTDVLAPTYYTTLADAQVPTNPIPNPDSFVGTDGQSIWVRLERDDALGCARITEFTLQLNTPSPIGVGDDLVLCDDLESGSATDGISVFDLTQNDFLIQAGATNFNVIYYASAQDQIDDIPIADPENYANEISPQQEIFVTLENLEGCRAENSFFIEVLPNPAITSLTPLVACDDDGDGIFSDFDLTEAEAEVAGILANVTTTFYSTEAAAIVGDPINELPDTYENIVPFNQTIYARVTNNVPPAAEACFTIVPLELIVDMQPNLPTSDFLDEISACDNGLGANEAVFNLTINSQSIFDAQPDPSIISITYYETEADALVPQNVIPTPNAYTSQDQTIFIRVENTDTGCFIILNFEIVVDELPQLGAGPYNQFACDDEVNGSTPTDLISTFNLTENTPILTDGNTSYTVVYYETVNDQNNDIPIVDPTAFQNTINPQKIFATIFTGTGSNQCTAEASIILEVLPNPVSVTPEPIEACDGSEPSEASNSDGITFFDLTIRESAIINGQSNVTIFYYETLENAEDAVNPIANPAMYQNTIEDNQIIYVRVTNDINATPPPVLECYTIVELELIVNPAPEDSGEVDDIVICELNFDGVASFDLTQNDADALNGQDPTLFTVEYFTSQTDALEGINAINNPASFVNTSNPQEIFVGIRNTGDGTTPGTGCFNGGLQSFFIEVGQESFANDPSESFVICDNEGDPLDGVGSFNLTDTSDEDVVALNNEILGGQSEDDYTITYHETPENAESGEFAISFPYNNVINPQRIYIRVTHTTGCYGTASMILEVEPSPLVELEELYRICVDANGDIIPEVNGEPSPPIIETGLSNTDYTFAWTINGELQVGEIGPSIVASEPGNYSVDVTFISNDCVTTAETTVEISSPPLTLEAEVINGAFANNHTIEVTATGDGNYEFQLDDGPFQESTTFNNVAPGSHTITARDINGCGELTITVSIIDYPRFMTPNQDGFNDTWNIIGIADIDPTAKIYIFDKYGKLLRQISPLSSGWNGIYNGEALPADDYWFLVEYTEEDISKQFRGHFSLKR